MLCCSSSGQIPSRNVAFDQVVESFPEQESVHLGLHLPCHRQAEDGKAGREPIAAAPGYLRRQTQSVFGVSNASVPGT